MNNLKHKKTHKGKHHRQVSEDIKKTIATGIAIVLTFTMTTLLLTQLVNASTTMRATYPKSFIPFWSQARGGHETALLNTNQIVRIVPYFDPIEEEPNHGDILHLEVYMADGKILTVKEDFDKFYDRVRVSQAK
tara:strand:+ start:503 stop:904 length:402 start_codon:yes stop_codon:yes gene_type:complete